MGWGTVVSVIVAVAFFMLMMRMCGGMMSGGKGGRGGCRMGGMRHGSPPGKEKDDQDTNKRIKPEKINRRNTP